MESAHLESVGLLASSNPSLSKDDTPSADGSQYPKRQPIFFDPANTTGSVNADYPTSPTTTSPHPISIGINPISSNASTPSASYLTGNQSRNRDARSNREPKSSKPII